MSAITPSAHQEARAFLHRLERLGPSGLIEQLEQGAPMPFHGVPYMLYTDQGAMFKSAPVRSFLSAMDVRQRQQAQHASAGGAA